MHVMGGGCTDRQGGMTESGQAEVKGKQMNQNTSHSFGRCVFLLFVFACCCLKSKESSGGEITPPSPLFIYKIYLLTVLLFCLCT